MYALLYVGSGVLSYVSRKLKLPRNQSVLYVQKSVRIPNNATGGALIRSEKYSGFATDVRIFLKCFEISRAIVLVLADVSLNQPGDSISLRHHPKSCNLIGCVCFM